MYWLVKICKKIDEATKNKARNKAKKLKKKKVILIKKKDYINKEHAYKIFLGGISTAKMSVTIQIKSSHKTLEGISTAKIS